MNKAYNVLLASTKKFFGITFALYTCISYGMMLMNIATVNGKAPEWSGVALLFSHILLFSALTAITEVAVGLFEKLNSALAHIIKFLLSYGAFYLCFFALQKESAQPINIVTISALFTVIYAVVAGIFGIFRTIGAKKANREAEYVSIYDTSLPESEEK